MTTTSRYPTLEDVGVVRLGWYERQCAEEIIRKAIDIERKRVAKEAGEVSCWRVAGGIWVIIWR